MQIRIGMERRRKSGILIGIRIHIITIRIPAYIISGSLNRVIQTECTNLHYLPVPDKGNCSAGDSSIYGNIMGHWRSTIASSARSPPAITKQNINNGSLFTIPMEFCILRQFIKNELFLFLNVKNLHFIFSLQLRWLELYVLESTMFNCGRKLWDFQLCLSLQWSVENDFASQSLSLNSSHSLLFSSWKKPLCKAKTELEHSTAAVLHDTDVTIWSCYRFFWHDPNSLKILTLCSPEVLCRLTAKI